MEDNCRTKNVKLINPSKVSYDCVHFDASFRRFRFYFNQKSRHNFVRFFDIILWGICIGKNMALHALWVVAYAMFARETGILNK